MEDWLSGGEPLQVSAVAWTEFLCGPVLPAHVEVAESLLGRPDAAGRARGAATRS